MRFAPQRYRLAACTMAMGALWIALTVVGSTEVATQSIAFDVIATWDGPADLIEVSGGRAVVTSERHLTVFDVTDPKQPRLGGHYTFPEKVWGFELIDAVVYAAVDFFGLALLDLSNIEAPSLLGSITTPGQAKGVGVYGTKALVADHVEGVDLIDLSNPSEPELIGSYYLDGYARDVDAVGKIAYAVDSPTGVYAFDLSQPGPPEPIAVVQSATAPTSVESPLMSGGDSPRLVCMVGGSQLQVYDISNPNQPINVGNLAMPSGRPLRVTVKDQLAYVADGRNGLQVVDLSVPSSLSILGNYATEKPVRDVAVTDSNVFVALGDHEGDEEGSVIVLQLVQ